jgi:mannose-6-phosphate isomerase-like protein (cupin superfamily)
MGYETASPADVESIMAEEDGGMWFLKDALDTERLGFTVLELEPGREGMEHDHTDDGQEEIYYVIDGKVTVELGEETVTLSANEAVRIDPDEARQVHNSGDERAELVLVGAPR